MILIVAMAIVLLRVFYSLGEMYFEHDLPRSTWKGLAYSLLLLSLCVSAFGQAARVDIPLQTTGPNVPMPSGPLPQALWLANSTVQVCAHPASPTCTPVATYNDSNKDATCPSTAPLVQLPGVTCTASTGAAANVGFWYGGGIVDYIVTSTYGTFGPYTVSPGAVGAGQYVSLTDTSPQTMAGPLVAPGFSTPAGNVIPQTAPSYTGGANSNVVLSASPALTGTPTVPTDTPCLNNALQVANETYVSNCSGSGSVSNQTITFLPVATAAGALGAASSFFDNGTTAGVGEPFAIGGNASLNALGTAVGTSNNYASFAQNFNFSYWTTGAVNDAWQLSTYICPYSSCGPTPTTTFNVVGPTTLTALTVLAKQNPSILATSGANIPTPCFALRGATWTGSASQLDDWTICGTYGTGANPVATLAFTKSRGTSGNQVVQFPSATFVAGTPGVQLTAAHFSTYPACGASTEGLEEAVNDSTTNTWGATVTGGGSDHIKMYCDGTNWAVEAK